MIFNLIWMRAHKYSFAIDFWSIKYTWNTQQIDWRTSFSVGQSFLAKINVHVDPYFVGLPKPFRNKCVTVRHYSLDTRGSIWVYFLIILNQLTISEFSHNRFFGLLMARIAILHYKSAENAALLGDFLAKINIIWCILSHSSIFPTFPPQK